MLKRKKNWLKCLTFVLCVCVFFFPFVCFVLYKIFIGRKKEGKKKSNEWYEKKKCFDDIVDNCSMKKKNFISIFFTYNF